MSIVICKIIMFLLIAGQMAFGTVQNMKASETSLKKNGKNCRDIFTSVEGIFGAQIEKNHHLFDINQDYVLQLKVGGGCQIECINVSPKYKWQDVNPTWKKPDKIVALADKEYRSLLAKIEQVKKIGSLVERGEGGIFIFGISWSTDEYENGFIERGERDYAPPGKSPGTHAFSIYFFREVNGFVESKNVFTSNKERKRATVRIKDHSYYVASGDIERIRVGEFNTLFLAGPID